MASIAEPTIKNVLFLGLLLVVSGAIILAMLRKLKMRVAASFFSVLLFTIGTYIPFYIIGTTTMSAVTAKSDPSFTFFFLKHQLKLLNTPFVFFESISLFVGIIGVLMGIALIIAIAFVLKLFIKIIANARNFFFVDALSIKYRLEGHTYFPNYHNLYLVTQRFRN